MQRGLIIKTCGNLDLTPIVNTFESKELKRLRAELGISNQSRSRQYKRLIREARRKYKIKPQSKFKQKIIGIYALLILILRGEV